ENSQRHPDRQVKPDGQENGRFDYSKAADDYMAHNGDNEIGRQVVGPVMMYFLAAMVAAMHRLQKLAETPSFATRWAASRKTAANGLENRPDRPLLFTPATENMIRHPVLLRPARCGIAPRARAFRLFNL